MNKSNVINRIKYLFIAISIVIVLFGIVKMLAFSDEKYFTKANSNKNTTSVESPELDLHKYITHKNITKKIDGFTQKINIIEININGTPIKIYPELSFGKIFGYELLSDIVKREGAYAAVNAGFFFLNGYPSGMVVRDGTLITPSTGKNPVFRIHNGKASIKLIKLKMWLNTDKDKHVIDHYNPIKAGNGLNIYSSLYGDSDRVEGDTVKAFIKNGKVTKVFICQGESKIPKDAYLVVMKINSKVIADEFPLDVGNAANFECSSELKTDTQAYECGSWLIENNKIVVPEKDPWVGLLTNHEPRTAIGIKNDTTVLLVTVDGRQPGYSIGITAKQLADLVLSLGATDAAMLDGGASTEMIFQGKITNRPSFKGEERPLGGGLMVEIIK